MGTPAYMAPEQLDGGDRRRAHRSVRVLRRAVGGARTARAPFVARRRSRSCARRSARGARAHAAASTARSPAGCAPHGDERWPSMDALLAALAPPRRLSIARRRRRDDHRRPRRRSPSPTAPGMIRARGALPRSTRCGTRRPRPGCARLVSRGQPARPARCDRQGTVDDYAAQWRAASVDTCRGAQVAVRMRARTSSAGSASNIASASSRRSRTSS